MANESQREELESIEAIYDGGGDVAVCLNAEVGSVEARICMERPGAKRAVLHFSAILPHGYLGEEGLPPTFKLASASLSPDQLSALCLQLDAFVEEQPDNPILFTWIEWLRLDSLPFLEEAAPSDGAIDPRASVFQEWEEREDKEEVVLSSAETCANCARVMSDDLCVGLPCSHKICKKCLAAVVQVHDACGEQPRCPLPCCQQTIPESMEGHAGMAELWAQVAQQPLGTQFQDSIVFCPRCEDLGTDTPVLLSELCLEEAATKDLCKCCCWRCSYSFCGVCRSPWHPGKDCYSEKHQIVRMSKRRPPLPAALADAAFKVALEAEEVAKNAARHLAESIDNAGFNDFEKVRQAFLGAYRTDVEEGLGKVLHKATLKLTPTHLKQEVVNRFMRALRQNKSVEVRPAFHGTNPANYTSIFERGLLIPGDSNELKIVNGAAHGKGVYTANIDAAWLSWGFNCGSRRLLICAVIHSSVVRHVGDAMIVGRSDNVVPLFEGTDDGPDISQMLPPLILAQPKSSSTEGTDVKSKGAKVNNSKDKDDEPKNKATKVAEKSSKFKQRLANKSNKH